MQTDGVIGDNVFEDKIVEIDYDQKIIVVHSSLPLITSDYLENEMRYRTGQPFIELTLSNGDKKYSSWFLFDTGSKYGLSVNSSFAVENNLYGTMESIGTRRGKGTDGVIIKSETVGLGGRPFPVFKNFYAGGLGSVRGYEQSTLGPRDVTGAFIGGTRKFVLNTEFITPFPGAGNDRTLRLFGFVDAGALYGDNDKISADALRYSTGVGLSWISPLGPLRFAFAVPLRKKPGDRIQRLQFQIGTSF